MKTGIVLSAQDRYLCSQRSALEKENYQIVYQQYQEEQARQQEAMRAAEAAATAKAECEMALSAARKIELTPTLDVQTEGLAKAHWMQGQTTCRAYWTSDDQAEASRALTALEAIDASRLQRQAAEGLEHLKRAWVLLKKKNQLVAAEAERRQAVALGVDVAQLDAALLTLENDELFKEWKAFAKSCARLSADKSAMERVRDCNASCEKVQAKVESAWDELASAALPRSPSGAAASQVKALCEKSGCPSCPN
jgi:hypothetical protein